MMKKTLTAILIMMAGSAQALDLSDLKYIGNSMRGIPVPAEECKDKYDLPMPEGVPCGDDLNEWFKNNTNIN